MPSVAGSNTTYTFNAVPLFTEVTNSANSNNSTDTTGKYKTYVPAQQGHDRNALYMKFGDTMSIPIYNPTSAANGGNTYQFLRGGNALTNQQQYPYPDGYAANSTAPTRSGTFTNTLTWSSGLTDTNPQTTGGNPSFNYDTAWPFYGGPYGTYSGTNGSGIGYKHSMRVRMSVVQGALYASSSSTVSTTNSGQALSTVVGSNIPLYGSGISGLNEIGTGASSMNSFANKLYLSVWNSNGTVRLTSGFSWQYGSQWVGFITNNVSSTTLYTGTLPAGSYRVYLNHYSGGTTSSTRDRRTCADSRLWYLDLTLTAAPDTEPTPSSFDFTDVTGQALNTVVESNLRTPTGYDAATQISISSGDDRAFRVFSPSAGSWHSGGTTGQTISPGNLLQLRVRTPTTNSTPRNTFVALGGVSSTSAWTVTTLASDISPDAITFNNVNGTVSQPEISNSVTLQGYDAATTITALASGTTVSINNGTFTSTIGTSVPTSASIRIKITPGTSFSTAYTGRVTVGGTQSAVWTVTTGVDTSGTEIAPVTGNALYGMEIKNDNSNVIFSPDFRVTSIVKLSNGDSVGNATIAQGATVTITGIEGALASNASDIIISLRVLNDTLYKSHKLSVLRTNNGFTITNNGVTLTTSAGSRSVEYMVMRV